MAVLSSDLQDAVTLAGELQIAKRIKHRCCFRLERGKRSGQMCREWIGQRMVGVRKQPGEPDTSGYCCTHALLVLDRWARSKQ